MGKMNAGLAAYLAKKKAAKSQQTVPQAQMPIVQNLPLTPPMVNAIKQAPKGKLPPGLARYLAMHKKK